MKILAGIIFTVILLGIVSGCVSMQQMQNGMNEIDTFWGEANQKIISSKGTRIYPNKVIDCWNAANLVLQLQRKVITQYSLLRH